MKKLLCVLMFGMVFGQDVITTRAYEYNLNMNGSAHIEIDLFDLTGYNLDYAQIQIGKVSNFRLMF